VGLDWCCDRDVLGGAGVRRENGRPGPVGGRKDGGSVGSGKESADGPLPAGGRLRGDYRRQGARPASTLGTPEITAQRAAKAAVPNAKRMDRPGCYSRACSITGALGGSFLAAMQPLMFGLGLVVVAVMVQVACPSQRATLCPLNLAIAACMPRSSVGGKSRQP
jgi:hypothetical protein